jgi:hypothetical protein
MWMKLNSLFCSLFKTFTFLSKYLLFLLYMGIQGELLPQEFNLVASYPSIKHFVAEDSFLKKYSIENGQVKQISQDSTILIYSNKQFGSVSEIDVSDPLNIIVFFRDFGVVTILDNNLSEKSIVLPRQMHENDLPSQVCFSSRHGFWAFFPNSFQLARFNFRGDRTQISEDLNFNAGLYDQVLFMQESEEMIFLYANGIWVFDLYTNFLYHIKHIQTPLIQVKGKKIFYIINDRMHVYDFFLKQEDVFLLPEKEIKNFFIKNNQIVYLQTSLSLKEYNHTGTFY